MAVTCLGVKLRDRSVYPISLSWSVSPGYELTHRLNFLQAESGDMPGQ